MKKIVLGIAALLVIFFGVAKLAGLNKGRKVLVLRNTVAQKTPGENVYQRWLHWPGRDHDENAKLVDSAPAVLAPPKDWEVKYYDTGQMIGSGNVWQDLLADVLGQFGYTGTFQYLFPDEKRYSSEYVIEMHAKGIAQSENSTLLDLSGAYKSPGWKQRVKPNVPDEMRRFFRSEAMRQVIYAWAMPSIKKMFALIPKEDQLLYLKTGEHGIGYLDGLAKNDSIEWQYLLDLNNGKCQDVGWRAAHGNMQLPDWIKGDKEGCIFLFVSNDPDGKESPYRMMDAFLFRRFHFDGIAIADQKRWAQRIMADLRPLVKQ